MFIKKIRIIFLISKYNLLQKKYRINNQFVFIIIIKKTFGSKYIREKKYKTIFKIIKIMSIIIIFDFSIF